MQAITKAQILKLLKDYCYTIYLGMVGCYVDAIWGLLIFAAIGFGFDRYVTTRKERLGNGLIDPKEFQKKQNQYIRYSNPKYNQDVAWCGKIVFFIFVYVLVINFLTENFHLSFLNWFNFTKPITDKMVNFYPLINTYSENMTEYAKYGQFDKYQISLVRHILGISVFLSFVLLPLMLQYFEQKLQYATDFFYANNSDTKASIGSKYARLILVFPVILSVLFLMTYHIYFAGSQASNEPIHQSYLTKFLVRETFKITAYIFLVYALAFMAYSLKNILRNNKLISCESGVNKNG